MNLDATSLHNTQGTLEARLKSKTIQFRTVLDTLPDYVFIKDVNGVYLACNKACEAYFGDKEHNIVGKTDYDLVDREIADSFIAKDNQAMEMGCEFIQEKIPTHQM